MRDKNRRQQPGGTRVGNCDHGLSRSWEVKVCKKKKNELTKDGIGVTGGITCINGTGGENAINKAKKSGRRYANL